MTDHVSGDGYDHDGVSIDDLMELGYPAVSSRVEDTGKPIGEPVWKSPEATAALNVNPGMRDCASPDAGQASVLAALDTDRPVSAHEAAAELPIDTVEMFPLDLFDVDEEGGRAEPDDPLGQLWYLEVPEADDEEVVREVSRAGVSSGERAVQLALRFLRDEGLYSERNLDLLADIIRQRGWSSVQLQVRGLVHAGYDIAPIHRMFQLTNAWLHCVENDALSPEYWHSNKRLTWLEAAHLLDFLGHDADFDLISDFLFAEQEVWYRLHRESGHLATFKSYLFQYRLSPRTELDEAGWQHNLDPRDMRSFDGTRNPLYRSCWWDEPVDSGASSVSQRFGAIWDAARIAEWLSPDTEEVF